jgi:hypothetical protein
MLPHPAGKIQPLKWFSPSARSHSSRQAKRAAADSRPAACGLTFTYLIFTLQLVQGQGEYFQKTGEIYWHFILFSVYTFDFLFSNKLWSPKKQSVEQLRKLYS